MCSPFNTLVSLSLTFHSHLHFLTFKHLHTFSLSDNQSLSHVVTYQTLSLQHAFSPTLHSHFLTLSHCLNLSHSNTFLTLSDTHTNSPTLVHFLTLTHTSGVSSPYVDGHDRQVDVVEQLVVIFDGHAGREEDHQLLLAVLLQEGEEQQEALLGRTHHVALARRQTNTQRVMNLGSASQRRRNLGVPAPGRPPSRCLCCRPLPRTAAPSSARCGPGPPPCGSGWLRTAWSVSSLQGEQDNQAWNQRPTKTYCNHQTSSLCR